MFVLCYHHYFRYTIHIHQYMIRNDIRQAADGKTREQSEKSQTHTDNIKKTRNVLK